MPILPVTNLNLKARICEASQEFTLGVNQVLRQISICAIDGASADPYFSTDCQTLRQRSQGLNLFLPRLVLLYDVCTTHLSREPARYRSRLSSKMLKVISRWLSRLYSAASFSTKRRLLRRSRQKQSQDTTAIIAAS